MLGANILIADDDEVSARFLTRLLTKEGCQVRVVQTSEAALAACGAEPPDLVLIDLLSPRGHGFEVCRSLKSRAATRLIPVVIVTARSERRDRLTSIEAGCDDFITKPYDEAELRARVRSLVRLKRYTDELETAETVMLGLGATIEARDPCTRGHCQRLARYATTLGRSLGLDEADLAALDRGGFLHDIGKIAVPDSVLLKGGALDAQESRVMREHPIIGDALCAGLRSFRSPPDRQTPPRATRWLGLSRRTSEPGGAASGSDRRHRGCLRRLDERPPVSVREIARRGVRRAGRRSEKRMARSGAGRRLRRGDGMQEKH